MKPLLSLGTTRRRSRLRFWWIPVLVLIVLWFVNRQIESAITPDLPDISVGRYSVQLEPTRHGSRQLRLGESTRSELGGIATVIVAGKAGRQGFARGRLLKDLVSDAARARAPMVWSLASDDGFLGWFSERKAKAWKLRHLEDCLPKARLRELAGMAKGAGISARSALYANLAVDLGGIKRNDDLEQPARNLSVLRQLGEQWLFGRVASLPGTLDGGEHLAQGVSIVAYRDTPGREFISIGSPVDLGVSFGMNRAKLVVSVHQLPTQAEQNFRCRMPATWLARKVLESATTVEEAAAIIEKTPPLGGAIFVLVGADSEEPVVIERTPSAFYRRDRFMDVVGDLFTTPRLKEDSENQWRFRQKWRERRIVRTRELVNKASSPGEFAAVLSDRSDNDLALPPGYRGAPADAAAGMRLVLAVDDERLWLQSGDGRSAQIDLRQLLHLGIVTAHEEFVQWPLEPVALQIEWRVRHHLRAARTAWRRGHRLDARESVFRALAYSPDHLDALWLAGKYSINESEAKLYFEQYLAERADDEIRANAVKALIERALAD